MWPWHLAHLIILPELVGYGRADLEPRDGLFDIGFQLVVPVAITTCILGCERLGGVPAEACTVCLQFDFLSVFGFPAYAPNIGLDLTGYPFTYRREFITSAWRSLLASHFRVAFLIFYRV